MSRKRKPSAALPSARADELDRLRPDAFLEEVRRQLWAKVQPTFTDPKLAGLAGVSDDYLFCVCISVAIKAAHEEATLLAGPIYLSRFIEKFDQVGKAAERLQVLLKTLDNPRDHTSLWAGKALGFSVNIVRGHDEEDTLRSIYPLRTYFPELSTLVQASQRGSRWADLFEIKTSGRPRGIKKTGAALTRFITRLEFAARASGGRWTLNKNEERGTLIDVLEILRPRLPGGFLSRKRRHPYQSYQKILSLARAEWTQSDKPGGLVPLLLDSLKRGSKTQ